ncbi:MAG: NAD(P)H-dependent oxidoreductase [bacterium]|nr:NAD(P)H-dependent oxidoreductase [bacterium]
MKRVLVINGHPDKESFNYALADAYLDGLQESNTYVQLLNIADLEFNPNLHFGYRKISVLEPDLLEAIEKIKQADHMVWILPMWWYGMPALMKGFIDRVFLPGSFFKYQKGNPFPKKLLTGKSARLIITADTVRWYDRWFMGSPLINQFKKGTLEFCGVKPVKVSYIAPIKESSGEFRAKWLEKIKKLGMSIA